MRKAHRLVGWSLSVGVSALPARLALAQSTATFPEEPPASTATARPKPAPAPPKPASPPSSSRIPSPTPPAKPSIPAAAPPPSSTGYDKPYTPRVDPALRVPELPAPGRDTRPPILPYDDGLPVPAGYEVVSRPVTGLVTGGVVGLVTSYGVGIIVGATQGFKNGTGWLAVPLIGPWAAIGTRKYECAASTTVAEARRCVNSAVGEVQLITFLAVDGIAQLATGFVTLAGLMSTRKALLRTDLLPAQVSVIPPGPGRDGWEVTARGEF
jgi:hypothetical protein